MGKSTVALGMLFAWGSLGAALAADIPVQAVMPMPGFYNWSGVYGGVHAGYGKGMKEWRNPSFDYDVQGFLAGGQIGLNQQIGNWLIGIEVDASWSNIRGSQALFAGGANIGQTLTGSASTNIDRILTAAGRLGFAQDRWLVYVKGGAAWAHENHARATASTINVIGGPAFVVSDNIAGSENRFGPMVGFGAEYALWGNWSFKSEYNYLHFLDGTARLTGTSTFLGFVRSFTADVRIPQAIHLAKFGVNYRFGPESPPAIAPARPASGYNWTGFFIGAQAAYGFGRKEWEGFGRDGHYDVKGAFAGGVTGTNVQAGVFVVGVESEWMWSGASGSRRVAQAIGGGATQINDFSSRIDWLSLNTARVGFVAADRWLTYFKGGVALAKESHTLAVAQVVPGFGSIAQSRAASALHTGYVAGVGVEHAFLGNWSVKLEYNYIHFRTQDVLGMGNDVFNVPGFLVAAFPNFSRHTANQDMHLVKFGLNYKFSGGLADIVTARF
jgi:opacity protein-like surface antigen